MRILHTADWHLCDRLGRLNRTETLNQRVAQVAKYCEDYQVELLLIAGDLFYEKATEAEITAAFRHIHQCFTVFFARGGTIVAITGNHDDDHKIQLVRSGMLISAPIFEIDLQPGRMYVQNRLRFCRFTSARSETIQLVLVPYPHAAVYELPDSYRTREEEYRLLQDRLANWLSDGVRKHPAFDMTIPTVLMAHLHIRGANLNRELFRFSNPTDVQMEAADLLAGFAYVALGHIHLPQSISNVETVRYPGPLDRLDFGEKSDERGVILVDLQRERTTTQWLALAATPMHEITLDDPDNQLGELKQKYPDHQEAIVKVVIKQSADSALSRDQIARQVKAMFPNWVQVQFDEVAKATTGTKTEPTIWKTLEHSTNNGRDYREVVRNYLKEALASNPEQGELLELVESFLAPATTTEGKA